MLVKTASYNSTSGTHNAFADENNVIDYSIRHEFNRPAEARVILADPDGTIMQKYDVGTDAVYVGPGRIKIEDPVGSTVFDGRIIHATHDSRNNRVMLYCRDWLDQLSEDRIVYDMREDLDGSGLREGVIQPDKNGLPANTMRPCYSGGVGVYWVMLDDQDYSSDQWNDYYLVFGTGMSGDVTMSCGPYAKTVTATTGIDLDAFDTDIGALWDDDDKGHLTSDNDEDWTVDYKFWAWITESSFHSSTVSAKVKVKYYLTTDGSLVNVQVYDYTNSTWKGIGIVNGTTDSNIVTTEFTIPGEYLDDIVNSDGEAKVRFDVKYNGLATTLSVYQILFEIECITTQDSNAYQIQDTGTLPSKVYVTTDLTLSGDGIWSGLPYSIVSEIYKHIDTEEGGTLISDHDPLVTLTAAATIEHTSGISTRHFEERTPLEILQELAMADSAVFWLGLGGTTVTWKSTFNDASPTALTDSDVLWWESGVYDYSTVRNEYHAYGPVVNANQEILSSADLASDPGASSKTKYGVTRSDVIKNPGTVTKKEMEELVTALVNRDSEVRLLLSPVLYGLSSLRLGDEVSVTSTYLDLSASVYVVTHWEYNYAERRTKLRLHPRDSGKAFMQTRLFGEELRHISEGHRRMRAELYVPAQVTRTWS